MSASPRLDRGTMARHTGRTPRALRGDPLAAAEWRRIAPALAATGRLSSRWTDEFLVVSYCHAFAWAVRSRRLALEVRGDDARYWRREAARDLAHAREAAAALALGVDDDGRAILPLYLVVGAGAHR